MWPKGLIVLAVSLIIPLAAQGQAQGGGAGGGSTGGNTQGRSENGSGTTRDGSTSGNMDRIYRGQQRTDTPQRNIERPIFLSERVVLSSGEAPTEPIRIQRVCGMRTTPEGYTDSKGRFSFQVGANASLTVMDASIGGWSTPGGTAGGGGFGNVVATPRERSILAAVLWR